MTKSIKETAIDLEFGTPEVLLQMIDLSVVDLSIRDHKFKSENDVRQALMLEEDEERNSERRKKCHSDIADLINHIIDYCEEKEEAAELEEQRWEEAKKL